MTLPTQGPANHCQLGLTKYFGPDRAEVIMKEHEDDAQDGSWRA